MFCNYNFKNLVLHLESVFIYNLFLYYSYFVNFNYILKSSTQNE